MAEQAAETATVTGKVIAMRDEPPRGALAFDPDATEFTDYEVANLVAIGVDLKRDPGVKPHALVFRHMCVSQGLDPYKKEAYLIGRGEGQWRKWTMQTGIDGYRKMAARTGRLVRVVDTLWTGQDDDPKSWYRDDQGVMRRVWWDQWPTERGFPGSAKVIVEHYDANGNVVQTTGQADWGMYAPFSPKYEGKGPQRRKVRGPDGGDVMVLNDMWAKGYPHMLAKCAEALSYRKAFPGWFGGFYTHEEMHRADQMERERLAAEQAAARTAAFERAQGRGQVTAGPVVAPEESASPVPAEGSEPTGPLLIGPLVEEAAADLKPEAQSEEPEGPSAQSTAPADAPGEAEPESKPEPDTRSEEDKHALAVAELDFLATLFGKPSGADLVRRKLDAAGVDSLDGLAAEVILARLIVPIRPLAYDKVDADIAEQYRAVEPTEFADIGEMLFPDVEIVDPTEPHAFRNQQGICALCEREEDDKIHVTS